MAIGPVESGFCTTVLSNLRCYLLDLNLNQPSSFGFFEADLDLISLFKDFVSRPDLKMILPKHWIRRVSHEEVAERPHHRSPERSLESRGSATTFSSDRLYWSSRQAHHSITTTESRVLLEPRAPCSPHTFLEASRTQRDSTVVPAATTSTTTKHGTAGLTTHDVEEGSIGFASFPFGSAWE